jgi:hypothetical protein
LCVQDDVKAEEWQKNPERLHKIQSLNCNFITHLLEKTRAGCDKKYFNNEYAWNQVF